MRILSNTPLELIKSIVEQNSGAPLWLHPATHAALLDRTVLTKPPIEHVYKDNTYAEPIDTRILRFAKCLVLTCKNGTIYRIGALLAPVVPGPLAFFLTTEMQAVLVAQTDAARHQDGTVQIYGAEPSLTVLVPEQLMPQIGKPLIVGDSVASFGVERLDSSDQWQTDKVQIPRSLIREIKLDD